MTMDLNPYFRSLVEVDTCAVVICDMDHTIIYMNPAADKSYAKRGGAKALLGKNLLDCHNEESCRRIREVCAWFEESREHNRIYTYRNEKQNKDVYMIALRDEAGDLIGYYEKYEYRDPETDAPYKALD